MPPSSPQIQTVSTFHELLTTPFTGSINALCWPRTLPGDFHEIATLLSHHHSRDIADGITSLDADILHALPVSPAGRIAIDTLLADLQRLRHHGLDPELNAIHQYLRDEDPGPVPTDLYSYHVDSATIPTDTWLCTYFGPPSEGLPNDHAQRRVDIPETRAQLLHLYGGPDDATFLEHLGENCFDLHYLPLPHAQPWTFGIGHLWRIATQYPGSPVLPCIHRAPETHPGQLPRLLLIS